MRWEVTGPQTSFTLTRLVLPVSRREARGNTVDSWWGGGREGGEGGRGREGERGEEGRGRGRERGRGGGERGGEGGGGGEERGGGWPSDEALHVCYLSSRRILADFPSFVRMAKTLPKLNSNQKKKSPNPLTQS